MTTLWDKEVTDLIIKHKIIHSTHLHKYNIRIEALCNTDKTTKKQHHTYAYQYSRGHCETTEIQSYRRNGPDYRGHSVVHSHRCSRHNRLWNAK